jgi:hypothetical protein
VAVKDYDKRDILTIRKSMSRQLGLSLDEVIILEIVPTGEEREYMIRTELSLYRVKLAKDI